MNYYHKNPRQITDKQFKQLQDTLLELGDLSGIVHDLNSNEIISGNQRSRVFDINKCEVEITERYDKPDKQGTVAIGFVIWQGAKYNYRQVRWTERQCEKANIVANKGGGDWNFDTLANEFELDDLLEWGFDKHELDLDLWQPENEETEDEPISDEELINRVPDAVWGSDNLYGIPMLDLNMQADHLEAPFAGWGTMARKNKMTGTYHFYVEDNRFEQVWRNPIDVANSACYALVEPNFSVYADMPKAVAIWQMFRKRWLARWFQSIGIRIIVDLNIAHRHDDLRFIGVPEGWKSYCTRAYSDRLNETIIEYEEAVKHAGGGTILFVCYGGGKQAEALSMERGWIWYPDQQTQFAGGKKNGKE